MFSDLEKKIISILQNDIPVCERPYAAIAEIAGTSEDTVIEILKKLKESGVIRRFGATLRHQKSGFSANAMAAWQVEEEKIDQVGQIMSQDDSVTHCYRRNPAPTWPYNLYTMIHASDPETCRAIAKKLSEKTGVKRYLLLFSKKELKKTSMQYITDSFDEDD